MKRAIGALSLGIFLVTMTGCNSGTFTETYVNEKDANQTLELTTNQAVGDAPNGRYRLTDGQTSTGDYTKTGSRYVLHLSPGGKEFAFAVQSESSLRDQGGNIWQLQTRSHTLR